MASKIISSDYSTDPKNKLTISITVEEKHGKISELQSESEDHPSVEPDGDAVRDGEVVHVEPDHGAWPRSSPLIRRDWRGRGRGCR